MRMQKILGGGYSLFNCLGGGGVSCAFLGGGERKGTNFIGGRCHCTNV